MKQAIMIYTNQQPQSLEIEASLKAKLELAGFRLVEPGQVPDYLITIGGDGTLLAAFHDYQAWLDCVIFIGIHTGHLGFYADWLPHELDELVDSLARSGGQGHVSYPLLKVQAACKDGKIHEWLALNECSLRTMAGTMVAEIQINDKFFATFRGDGLCIATPTGSTGLNKSLGGAVMHPRVDALQLTEMAALNNRVYRTLGAPMIIPRDEYLTLVIQEEAQTMLMIDHLTCETKGIQSVKFQLADTRIKFASFRHTHFWDRVENSFIGHKQERDPKIKH